ncbi:unnamed protein product [Gongylonema pulchrum]|uniref:Carboxylesterase type B domain-containing protein n=1 Tax=Gongylonema pulchrum TaxID=637853 RepID=A0A3P6R7A4_9BILA|nr:unnamed protein product [Gongylonema pulchrum]
MNEAEQRHVLLNIVSDQNFVAPAAREALLYARNNRIVYAYVFEYENAHLLANIRASGIQKGDFYSKQKMTNTNFYTLISGASHGNDCSFIFNNALLSHSSSNATRSVKWNEEEQEITLRLINQIADFVHKRSRVMLDYY